MQPPPAASSSSSSSSTSTAFLRPAAASAWAEEFVTQQHTVNVPARFDDLEQFEAWRGGEAAAAAAVADADALHHAHVRDDLRRLARRYREPNASAWAEEYARDVLPPAEERDDAWAAEFVRGGGAATTSSSTVAAPQWAEEFRSELQPTAEAWASEFQREQGAKFAQQKQLLDEFLGTTQSTASDTTNDDSVSATSASSSLDTRFATYEFASPNPYLNSADPFAEGQQLFRNGSLAEAILALEAAVQRAPHGIASKAAAPAWALLGQAHAENDHDDRAIACLMRAVDADNGDLSALISLGVSCANDYYRDEALNLLETWLDQHPDYRHLAAQMPPAPVPLNMGGGGGGGGDAWVASFERHARVTALFLRAANLKPTTPDANVQTALGLLYNLSYEYDRAADCFRAALGVQPDNYSLWNKLGATLANGNDSRAALAAYHRALALKPQYVRARANLGIAHLALGEFDGAAHHLSLALKRHGASNDEHLWNNLELVCRLMENEGAAQRAHRRDAALLNEFAN